METHSTKTERLEGNPMDAKLEAIKNIIVGNNFERIDERVSNLSKKIDTTNGRLIKIVEELSSQLNTLKKGMNEKISDVEKRSFQDDEDIRNSLFKYKEAFDELTEKVDELEEQLDDTKKDFDLRVQLLEDDVVKRLDAFDREQQQRFQKVEQRFDDESRKLQSHIDVMHKRTEELSADNRELRFKLSEERQEGRIAEDTLHQAFEKEIEIREDQNQRLLDELTASRLETKELKAQMKERSRGLASRQQILDNKVNSVETRVLNIHDLIEKEVFSYFEDLGKMKKGMKREMQDMQDDYRTKLEKSILKIEARIETLFELNIKEIQKINNKVDKKKNLRKTLDRLSDLLDD